MLALNVFRGCHIIGKNTRTIHSCLMKRHNCLMKRAQEHQDTRCHDILRWRKKYNKLPLQKNGALSSPHLVFPSLNTSSTPLVPQFRRNPKKCENQIVFLGTSTRSCLLAVRWPCTSTPAFALRRWWPARSGTGCTWAPRPPASGQKGQTGTVLLLFVVYFLFFWVCCFWQVFFVVGCWLLIVGCWLSVVGCCCGDGCAGQQRSDFFKTYEMFNNNSSKTTKPSAPEAWKGLGTFQSSLEPPPPKPSKTKTHPPYLLNLYDLPEKLLSTGFSHPTALEAVCCLRWPGRQTTDWHHSLNLGGRKSSKS